MGTELNYFTYPGLSRSDIVQLLRGPNYFRSYKKFEKKSPALDFGTAFHMALLEPTKFNDYYAVVPEGMKLNRKDGIEWKAQNEHREIIKFEDYEMLVSMCSSIKTHSWSVGLFENPKIEKMLLFEFEGEKLKAKPDLFSHVIVDFKTTRSLNERTLAYATIDHGYDIQAWMCREAVRQNTGEDLKFYDFFVEKTRPYDTLVSEFWDEDYQRAEEKVRKAIAIYRECIKADIWPSLRSKDPIRLNLSFVGDEAHEEEQDELRSVW